MSHFGSGLWPTGYGVVDTFHNAAATTTTTTATGSTEGTDLHTYTTARAGVYRVTVSIGNQTVSNAATSDVMQPFIAYTSTEGAQSAAALVIDSTQLTLNATTSGASMTWVGNCQIGTAGGTIAVSIKNTVSGTKTLGKANWYVIIEQIY